MYNTNYYCDQYGPVVFQAEVSLSSSFNTMTFREVDDGNSIPGHSVTQQGATYANTTSCNGRIQSNKVQCLDLTNFVPLISHRNDDMYMI